MATELPPLSRPAARVLVRAAHELTLLDDAKRKACEEAIGSAVPEGAPPRDGAAILTGTGGLADDAVAKLLGAQREKARVASRTARSTDRRIGAILARSGAVKPAQVEAAVALKEAARAGGVRPIPRLGEILVQKGLCTKEQVDEALREQKKVHAVCSLCVSPCVLDAAGAAPTCAECGEPLILIERMSASSSSPSRPPAGSSSARPPAGGSSAARPPAGGSSAVRSPARGRGGASSALRTPLGTSASAREGTKMRGAPAPTGLLDRIRHQPALAGGIAAGVLLLIVLAFFALRGPDHTAEIQKLLLDADSAVRFKRWDEAQEAYAKVLALEPGQARAKEGKAECEAKIADRRSREAAEAARAAGQAYAETDRRRKEAADPPPPETPAEPPSVVAAPPETSSEPPDAAAPASVKSEPASPTVKPVASAPAKPAAVPPVKASPASAVSAPPPTLPEILAEHRYAALRDALRRNPPDEMASRRQFAAAADLWDGLVAQRDRLKGQKIRLSMKSSKGGVAPEDAEVADFSDASISLRGLHGSDAVVAYPWASLAPEGFVDLAKLVLPKQEPAVREQFGLFLLLHGRMEPALIELAEARKLGADTDAAVKRIAASYLETLSAEADVKEIQSRLSAVEDLRKKYGRLLSEAAAAEFESVTGSIRERLTKREPDELLASAEQAIGKKQYREAQILLNKLLKQYPQVPAADRAREIQRKMPTVDGRLLLGFDTEEETKPSKRRDNVSAAFVGDAGKYREGSGAVNITLPAKGGGASVGGGFGGLVITEFPPPMIQFAVPGQSFDRMKGIFFWLYSDKTMGKTGAVKFCLFDGTSSWFEFNVQVTGAGWQQVRIAPGQFRKEGTPNLPAVNAVGFLNQTQEPRGFLLDSVRVLE